MPFYFFFIFLKPLLAPDHNHIFWHDVYIQKFYNMKGWFLCGKVVFRCLEKYFLANISIHSHVFVLITSILSFIMLNDLCSFDSNSQMYLSLCELLLSWSHSISMIFSSRFCIFYSNSQTCLKSLCELLLSWSCSISMILFFKILYFVFSHSCLDHVI